MKLFPSIDKRLSNINCLMLQCADFPEVSESRIYTDSRVKIPNTTGSQNFDFQPPVPNWVNSSQLPKTDV